MLRWARRAAAIRTASGSRPHRATISATSSACSATRCGPTISVKSAAASSCDRTSSDRLTAPSSVGRRRREVISTRLPGFPGINGRTCSVSRALSSTISIRRWATSPSQSCVRSSSCSGSRASSTPTARSRRASAAPGSSGGCPGVKPCRSRKIWPSGKRSASAWPTLTARVVLPTPAIPSMAEITTAAPGCRLTPPASCSSRSISAARPVKSATTYGSRRGTKRSVAPPGPAGRWSAARACSWAAASSRPRSVSSSPRAWANKVTEDRRGWRRPVSSTLIACGDSPDLSASSSWVHPARRRNSRSSAPKTATLAPRTAKFVQPIRDVRRSGAVPPARPADARW